MGDIKLIAGINDRLRLLVDESRNKIDLFANRWDELASKIPRNSLLPQFDGLANVLTNVNAEVTCRKFASLHGYEYSSNGMLSFEEVPRNMNMGQRASYYDNTVSGDIYNRNSVIQPQNFIATPNNNLSNSQFIQANQRNLNTYIMNDGRIIY